MGLSSFGSGWYFGQALAGIRAFPSLLFLLSVRNQLNSPGFFCCFFFLVFLGAGGVGLGLVFLGFLVFFFFFLCFVFGVWGVVLVWAVFLGGFGFWLLLLSLGGLCGVFFSFFFFFFLGGFFFFFGVLLFGFFWCGCVLGFFVFFVGWVFFGGPEKRPHRDPEAQSLDPPPPRVGGPSLLLRT